MSVQKQQTEFVTQPEVTRILVSEKGPIYLRKPLRTTLFPVDQHWAKWGPIEQKYTK